MTKVRKDSEKLGLKGMKGLGVTPAPVTTSLVGGGDSNSSSSDGNGDGSGSGGGGLNNKPVGVLSKRSLKRAKKLGLVSEEDAAAAKGAKRAKLSCSSSNDAAGSARPAAVAAHAPTLHAQILSGQSALAQDLRFVSATRKLGRGLQDG